MVHHRRPSWWKLALLLLLAVALVGPALVGLRVGAPPELSGESDRPGIGQRTRVTIEAREPGRGLSGLRVELVQGARRTLLAERRYAPQPAWAPWAPRTTEDTLEVEVGRELQPDLAPGEATIRVTAGRAGTWLR